MATATTNGRAARNGAAKRSKPANRQIGKRLDVVMIRKSGSQQDEQAQATNVGKMLAAEGVTVDDEDWFSCTVPRKDVAGNADFKRLMQLVESNAVRTIYVEMQDRFGTDDPVEFFAMVKTLRDHRTRLYDLRGKMDLTQKDDATLMQAFINALKSSKERRDLSYRVMRKRVEFFTDSGSWPSGVQPFGFGKRCYEADGKTLLWEWQPTTRTTGQLFFPAGKGKLKAGPKNVGVPRKEPRKRLVTKLVKSTNKDFVKTVEIIFDLYVYKGLSYRAISKWLNENARKFYDKPFTHGLVREILRNPAYVGDTHYGKMLSASYYSFDSDANVIPIEEPDDESWVPGEKHRALPRDIEEQLVSQNTHKGLIDRKTWNLAQDKIEDAEKRTSHPPRNPQYYLHQILVCGHCGKSMSGRPEKDSNGEMVPVYFCSSYIAGRSNGQKVKCGAYRIRHDVAEQMLLDKLKELKVEHDELGSATTQNALVGRFADLDIADLQNAEREQQLVEEGVKALLAYYKEHYGKSSAKAWQRFEQATNMQYGSLVYRDRKLFTKQFREIVRKTEADDVAAAKAKLAKLEKDHTKLTSGWADITDLMRAKLTGQAKAIEAEMEVWRERIKTVSERLNEIYQASAELHEKHTSLLKEWPALEQREKGEALRRIFKTVTLYWGKEFKPRSKKPSRPLKTNRKGRNAFTLLKDQILWDFSSPNLDGSV
ncbi:MAG: recombinase family protein [Pirellulales bacterium]